MGTRADFYIGRGKDAEWLGSIAWDGYPDGVPETLLEAWTEDEFRERVKKIASEYDDFTAPERGWPWPWNDSNTTDYAYAYDTTDDEVYYTVGYTWHKHSSGPQPDEEPDGPRAVFPDMSDRKNVRMDKGSGLIVINRKS